MNNFWASYLSESALQSKVGKPIPSSSKLGRGSLESFIQSNAFKSLLNNLDLGHNSQWNHNQNFGGNDLTTLLAKYADHYKIS